MCVCVIGGGRLSHQVNCLYMHITAQMNTGQSVILPARGRSNFHTVHADRGRF